MDRPKALIMVEGALLSFQAKTAHGLLRRSGRYEIVGLLDSEHAGMDSGEVVHGAPNGIPIFGGLEAAIDSLEYIPEVLVVGVATIGGLLPLSFRPQITEALSRGMEVVSGLHEFLGDDHEFSALAGDTGAVITDIRKWKPINELHDYLDIVGHIPALRMPVLGTDSSIGKRTTAWLVTDALNDAGVPTVFVATGQTGLLQGAEYGVPLDAIRGDYMVGELEHQIYKAYREKEPRVIVVEGQGSISHPAYVSGTRAVLSAAKPNAIILQHAPGRRHRHYGLGKLDLPMPDIGREMEAIELLSGSKVRALTINHEELTDGDLDDAVREYGGRFGIPVCDPLRHGCSALVAMVRELL